MADKLTDLQTVVNFMMQNNVMQLTFPLQDTSEPVAKTGAPKKAQKIAPTVSKHGKGQGDSHRPSKDVGHTESMQGESQRTPRTKGTYVRGSQQIHGQGLCFDDKENKEKSKRTHLNIGSNTPKKLKSTDSRAPS
ncbi:hypothetical protein ACSBR2_039494 [Camellia fascicularis]